MSAVNASDEKSHREKGLYEVGVHDNETELEQLVITTTRSPASVFDSPYSITVVKESEFKQKQFRSLPEALTDKPGVLIQKTANGHGSPFIRGFTGYRTLALIDNVRYNNSVYRDGPNEYFSLVDFNTLESLELLNGPASALYGSDAIGGTLNLKTKSSSFAHKKEGQFFIHGSQFNRLSTAENSHISRTELEIGKGQSWGLHLGYSFKNFNDIDAANLGTLSNTGYDEYSYDARLDINLNDEWNLTFVHQTLSQEDVWRTHSTTFSKSFAGTAIGTDLRRFKDQKRGLNYVKLSSLELNNYIQKLNLTLSYQGWDEDGERTKSDNSSIFNSFNSRMFGADLQLESSLSFANLVYGIDYYQDKVDSARSDFNANGSLHRIRIQGPVGDDSTYELLGAYIQVQFFLTDRLSVLTTSRFTHINAKIGKFENPETGLASSFSDSWTSNVNSIRAIYSLDDNDALKIWSGISQSFRAPNIADLSRFGASRSNETEIAATNLKPEKFLTYELGSKANHKNFQFTGTYYVTQIKDYITSTPTGRIIGDLTEVSKQNSSSGFSQGVELSADYTFDNNITPYGNVTWLEGELDVFSTTSSATSITEPLSRTLPMTSTIGIKWNNKKNSLWLDFSATHAVKANKLSAGDINDTQRIPPGGTPAYTLVNLRGGKRISEHFDINLALTNLLDTAYRTHGSGSNEPGFGLTIGLNGKF